MLAFLTFKDKCLSLPWFYRRLDQKNSPLLASFNAILSFNRSVFATSLFGLLLINQSLT